MSNPESDTPPRHQSFHFRRQISKTVEARYLLFLPRGYGDDDRLWPLLLFLHGKGERGDDLALVKAHGPPKVAETLAPFPFVVASPQCPAGRTWSGELVIGLLDEVLEQQRIDPDRVYLTGLSMGGTGTWETAIDHPERFAAIAVVCGRDMPELVSRIAHLPIRVFHGARDDVVPASCSKNMVEALREVGADVQFTLYPDAGHDSWTPTYANPELYEWFLRQRRRS